MHAHLIYICKPTQPFTFVWGQSNFENKLIFGHEIYQKLHFVVTPKILIQCMLFNYILIKESLKYPERFSEKYSNPITVFNIDKMFF